MKTKANELCTNCRQLPSLVEGLSIGEMIDFLLNDASYKDATDDEINYMIFMSLDSQKGHCNKCWQIIFDRQPDHMKKTIEAEKKSSSGK